MNGVRERVMHAHRRSPLIIEPAAAGRELTEIIRSDPGAVAERLLEYGAVLFRGFRVQTLEDFDCFVGAVTGDRLDYLYGSTPRTSLGNRIYTATEYPPPQEIPLHCESSYQRDWPLKLALCCLVPASSGGETPIADMRAVTQAVGADLLERFETLGVQYVRHYRPFVDLPWQKVFQTDNAEEMARFCREHDIDFEWVEKDTLRTAQVCQGTACHPVTGERIFFNQAHVFHVSSLGDAGARSMIDVFGPNRLPRQTFYGDGREIPPEDLAAVRAAFSSAKLVFPWQAGDVLMLDNMQFAHGRRPFKGTRKVVVSLMESSTTHAPSLANRLENGVLRTR